MTLQQLEYILAVNQFRHFAKAAEYCRVTQPTLSAMIQKLEEELDTRIFDRSQQPVCPTPVGIHIIEQAQIPAASKYKIYVSALTTISLDDHNWIPTTDNRLLRRIIRDFNYRGYSAQETISRWPSVRAGEDKWIFPYQENADVMFNSALLFEFAVLRCHAEPILTSVPRNCPEYAEAYRLLKFIKYFTPVQDKEIPPTSLLREFLGGSSFKY